MPTPPASSSASKELGDLPLWDLTALYPSIDSPTVSHDLDRALAESQAFEGRYKGKLADLLAEGGSNLAEAITFLNTLNIKIHS